MRTFLRILSLISGALMIVAGVMCLFNTDAALSSLVVLMGISMMYSGATSIAYYSAFGRFEFGGGLFIMDGILSFFLGFILMFTNINLYIAAALPIVFAIWIFARGLVGTFSSFDIKDLHFKYWYVLLIISLIAVAVGVVTMFIPTVGAVIISIFVGLSFIVSGVMTIYLFFASNKLKREIKDKLKEKTTDDTIIINEKEDK